MNPNRTTVNEGWFSQGFNALYPIVYAHRSVQAAQPEAEFALRHLNLPAKARVLDLACGTGRHMVHLARSVQTVIGLDYSVDLLKQTPEPANVVRADMRAIPFSECFDAVTSFFTSFGYFLSDAENAAVLHEVERILKSSGRFFVDYFNASHVERTLVPESVRTTDGYLIHERRWIDTALRRVNKVTEVERDGTLAGQWSESVRMYTEPEFRSLLTGAGLLVDSVFGDYDGLLLAEDSPRMIFVGHKR